MPKSAWDKRDQAVGMEPAWKLRLLQNMDLMGII